jgi:hypothetical protein
VLLLIAINLLVVLSLTLVLGLVVVVSLPATPLRSLIGINLLVEVLLERMRKLRWLPRDATTYSITSFSAIYGVLRTPSIPDF